LFGMTKGAQTGRGGDTVQPAIAALSPPCRTWRAELGMRARRYFVVTVIATSVVIGLFFIGYFHVLRHPAYPLTVMPLTGLDRLIPFQPHAFFAYLSLWVYVGFGPGLQRTYTELFVYGAWMAALCLTGLALLYFWPTEVPPVTLDVSAFPGIAMLRRVDALANACPSMHVAAAAFTGIRVHEVLRCARSPLWLRLLNWTWCGAIIYSTLAIKQHVVLDVAAGAVLGAAFALSSIALTSRSASPGGVPSPVAPPQAP
jgi:membrane-associated phospholipid phosphatase